MAPSKSDIDSALDQIDQNLEAATARWFDLLRIESISTDPAYKAECAKAGQYLVDQLLEIGFDARLHETPGHPMVVAHHEGPENAPHVLFYGHYDVQPVDPLELWTTPPFEPTIVEVDSANAFMLAAHLTTRANY